MLGMGKRPSEGEPRSSTENHDVVKLFFDTFSGRLSSVETGLRNFSAVIEKLKVSGDLSKLSDLVLLERLQKTEKLLGESLNWIKQVADELLRIPTSASTLSAVVETPSETAKLNLQSLTVQSPILT